MNVLINIEDLVIPLAKQLIRRRLIGRKICWTNTDQYLAKQLKKFKKTKLLEVNFAEINTLIHQDLQEYKDQTVRYYKKTLRPLARWLAGNSEHQTIKSLASALISDYVHDSRTDAVKALAGQLTDCPRWIYQTSQVEYDSSLLIRNTINHESVLARYMNEQREFWFVDSGYTNFLEKGKKWHRITHNHVHQTPVSGAFDASRLKYLPSFPQSWKTRGDKILVVCASDYHYKMMGTDRSAWCSLVGYKLSQLTDKKVEFREKGIDVKTRGTVYDLLKDSNDYYCVVHDASAAGIEAIWAGVPVITLGKHITSSVARTRLEDVNDLYRGPVGDWLCELTHSQYTFEEICNGQALERFKKYHV
jgi:hypothetical protein